MLLHGSLIAKLGAWQGGPAMLGMTDVRVSGEGSPCPLFLPCLAAWQRPPQARTSEQQQQLQCCVTDADDDCAPCFQGFLP